MIEAGLIFLGFCVGLMAAVFLTVTAHQKPGARRCPNGKPHAWGKWQTHGSTYNKRTCESCGYTHIE